MKTTILAIAALAMILGLNGCTPQEEAAMQEGLENAQRDQNRQSNSDKVCDQNGKIYQNENAAIRAGLDEAQYGATYCEIGKGPEAESKVCDEFGNVYDSERLARRAGLSESQYGATLCK